MKCSLKKSLNTTDYWGWARKVKIVPIEAHYSVGIIERYYGLIRRAYLIITAEVKGITKEIVL